MDDERVLGSCACSYCSDQLDEDEIENPYVDDCDEIMCDDCYKEHYMETCPICEEWYEKPTNPEETFFVVSKEASEECEVEAGFYQVTDFPYWLGATGFGFEMLFKNAIKLIRACDINSMLQKLHRGSEKIGADECCSECVKKYTEKKYRYTQWCDPKCRIHRNIFERGVIEHGA